MFTRLCFENAVRLACANKAHCFYCYHAFNPQTLTAQDWTDKGKTALCPACGVDAVVAGEWSQAELEGLRLGHFEGA